MKLKTTNYISTIEASQKYSYHRKTLIRWIKQKHIEGVKRANRWWINENSLKTYIQAIEI